MKFWFQAITVVELQKVLTTSSYGTIRREQRSQQGAGVDGVWYNLPGCDSSDISCIDLCCKPDTSATSLSGDSRYLESA